MWDPYAEFETAVLPNGLTVHAAHWPGRSWEAMGFLIHSGAEHDPVGLEGLAHFVEHLVSENTKESDKKQIEDFFENCGGSVNLGETTYQATVYRFFSPKDKAVLSEALSLFGHMLLAARLEKKIERERQVILREFHRSYPFEVNYELDLREHREVYAGYWLEKYTSPLGSPESFMQIRQTDLQAYYDSHYTPANLSIVGVGGLALAELVSLLIESPFAIRKQGVRTRLPSPVYDLALPNEKRHIFTVSDHINAQKKVASYRSTAKLPGAVCEQAVYITKKMFGEVLNEEVREKRAWTYSIHCKYYYLGYFYDFLIACDAFDPEAIDEIEELVESCIESIPDREDLFKQVKLQIITSCLMVDLSGQGVRNEALGELRKWQRIHSLAEIRTETERIVMDDIRQLLHWLRPECRWTLITRP
jgi:predicted Zn-dependent peptidase